MKIWEEKRFFKLKIIGFIILITLIISFPVCKKAVLTAPDNSTLMVTVNPAVIPLGGLSIVRVVGFKASGTPVPDGTVIFFATDIGTIEAKKETVGGVVESIFKSNDNRSGIANITVSSGTAVVSPESISISVGSSGLDSLSLSAVPPVLPIGGGVTSIIVTAQDESFNPLPNIAINLSSDAGTLNSAGNALTTDINGKIQDYLQTSTTTIVTAKSGAVEESITVHVSVSEPPTASFVYSPTDPVVQEKIYFNASSSSDPDGTIVSYSWDFGDGYKGSGISPNHAYKELGSYTVVLVVKDNDGDQSSSNQTITITQGTKPVAAFIYSPTSPKINESINFNASESTDADGYITAYHWNFGDGEVAHGQTVTHQFNENGSFTVILTVTDNDNNTDTATQTLTIGENESPVATFIYSPTDPMKKEDVHFDASDSYDPDGAITSYQWDFGDGSTATNSIPTVIHKFHEDGTFTVYLRVTDNSGNTGTYEESITISANKAPHAEFEYSPTSPYINDTVYFNATASYDEDGYISKYSWDFGDGNFKEGRDEVTTDHTYTVDGTYKVILTITDNNRNTTTVSQSITIRDNSDPVAIIKIDPDPPTLGDEATFDGSFSDDPNGDIQSWTWNFGDGSIEVAGETVNYTYSTSGTYNVTLTVEDEEGKTDTATKTITVQ